MSETVNFRAGAVEALHERIHALEQALGEAQSSQQICVGAAGIGDFSEMCGWIDQTNARLKLAQSKLRAFEEAMELERKPDWIKEHTHLADRLYTMSAYLNASEPDQQIMLRASRELRYMAESFTLKANFVPAELRIKELEAESVRLCDEIVKLKEREQEHAKIIGMREGVSPVDQSEHPSPFQSLKNADLFPRQ